MLVWHACNCSAMHMNICWSCTLIGTFLLFWSSGLFCSPTGYVYVMGASVIGCMLWWESIKRGMPQMNTKEYYTFSCFLLKSVQVQQCFTLFYFPVLSPCFYYETRGLIYLHFYGYLILWTLLFLLHGQHTQITYGLVIDTFVYHFQLAVTKPLYSIRPYLHR